MSVPTTRALILAHAVERNADRVISALTEDFGLMSLTARSSRSAKAKLGGVLEPFALTTLTFAEGRARPTVVGSVPEERYAALAADPLGFSTAHVLVECLSALQRERTGDILFEEAVETFGLLEHAVKESSTAQAWWIVARFLNHTLEVSGFAVSLDHCAKCGKEVGVNAVWVSGRGGLVHAEHAGESGRLRLPAEAQAALAALVSSATVPARSSLLPLVLLLRETQLHIGRRLTSVRYAQSVGALPLPPTLARLLYS